MIENRICVCYNHTDNAYFITIVKENKYGTVQAGIYRFPTCSFILTLVNALKCLILQALRAFLI